MLPPPEWLLAEAQLSATASMRDEDFRTNTALTANPVLDESGGRALGVRRPSSGVGSSLVRETPER
jgi:hypothetical protein